VMSQERTFVENAFAPLANSNVTTTTALDHSNFATAIMTVETSRTKGTVVSPVIRGCSNVPALENVSRNASLATAMMTAETRPTKRILFAKILQETAALKNSDATTTNAYPKHGSAMRTTTVATIQMNQRKSVKLTNAHEDGLVVLRPTDAFLTGPSATDKTTAVMEVMS
jgi:hypothetical protein